VVTASGLLLADTIAQSPTPSLLFVGKYPTDVFPVGTQYGVEMSVIRSPSSDVAASLQFPADSGITCALLARFCFIETIDFVLEWVTFYLSSANGLGGVN